MTSYPRIPDEELASRWRRLQKAMAEAGLDIILACADDHAVAGPGHARYLADFAPHFEPVVILRGCLGPTVCDTRSINVDICSLMC
jgi:hypothetical protein